MATTFDHLPTHSVIDNNEHTRNPSFTSTVFDLDLDDQTRASPTANQQHIYHSSTTSNSTSNNYEFYPTIKSEPDLTIPLGWDNVEASPSLSHTESPELKYLHPPGTATNTTSAYDFETGELQSPQTQQYQHSPSIDWADPLNHTQYGDGLFANSGSAPGTIPWSQWTDFEVLDMDMPRTPVDQPLTSFDVYTHTNGSEGGFFDTSPRMPPQACPPNVDLLPHFTSMQLDSPPHLHRSPPTATYSVPVSGDDHLEHNPHPSTASFYDSISHTVQSNPVGVSQPMPMSVARPMSVISPRLRPHNADMSDHHQDHNLIPTLSSSLPASLALISPSSIHGHSGEGRSGLGTIVKTERVVSPSSPSRHSPPATRGRSRAKSDASAAPPPTVSSPTKPHSPRHGLRRRKVDDLSGPAGVSAVDASPLKPPKQSLSTWQIFFTDWIARQDAIGGRKLNVAQAAKEAGKEYKLLTKAQKEPYERRAAEARAGRQMALSNWHSTLTPSLIALENRYRSTQRKLGLSRKSNLKDPNAPKKPLSAYFMFLKAVREDDAWSEQVFEGEKETTRQSVMAAAKWREMSDDEKRPFLARAEQEKLEYEAARKEYEDSFNNGVSRDSSSSPTDGSGSSSRHHNNSHDRHHRARSNSTGSTAMAFRLDDISPPLASSAPSSNASMGYFSANSSSAPIPIHIPKRSRAESSPSPTSPYYSYFSATPP